MKDYGKSFGKGIIIVFAVILLYTLFDWVYFNNQLLLADYIDVIKSCFLGVSMALYLLLVYFFYKKINNRRLIDLMFLIAPYFLMFLFVLINSANIPRLIDVVYLLIGFVVLYKMFVEGSFVYKRKYLFFIFLFFTVVSYPVVYENINYAYYKSKNEEIEVKGIYDFSILDTKGNKINLSELKSKTVCIDMWSSTCGGCIRSMPDFEKLNVYFKNNQNYKIISLFCPMKKHETYEWFKNYIKEDFDYNIDYYYINKDDFNKLGIYQFPEFMLLNKNNLIVYRGTITYSQTAFDNIYKKLEKINLNE